jgi:hypothetical protein
MVASKTEKDPNTLLVVLEDDDMKCHRCSDRILDRFVVPFNPSFDGRMDSLRGENRGLVIVVVKDLTLELVSRMEVIAQGLGKDYKTIVIFTEGATRWNRARREVSDGSVTIFPQLKDFVSTIRLLLEMESVVTN